MAFFKDLMDKVFKVEAEKPHDANPRGVKPKAAPAGGGLGDSFDSAGPGGAKVDVEAKLDALNRENPQDLDWRNSIVDLMKLVGMDSSLSERKELAQDLGYDGALDGSAEMNIWLHKQVMKKLEENGGRVPRELLD